MIVLVLGLSATTAASAEAAAPAKPVRMVVLGDSLSAGYGLPADAAFPARLEESLKSNGIDADIGNAGVSGDTSSGGRDRLDWSVPEGTQAVILELGANDALRGTDPKFTRAGVAADARLNQADGMHPTAEGVDVIVKNILPTVKAFLGAFAGQHD